MDYALLLKRIDELSQELHAAQGADVPTGDDAHFIPHFNSSFNHAASPAARAPPARVDLPAAASYQQRMVGAFRILTPFAWPAYAVGAAGFCAAAAQALILRELLVLFQGNELSAGPALAAWLFWTALGSRLGEKGGKTGLSTGLFVMAVSFPAAVLLLRGVRAFPGVGPGGALPLWSAALAAGAAAAPLCLASGFVFATGWSATARMNRGSPARVYLGEAAGAALGGLFVQCVVLPRLDAVTAALAASLLLFAMGFMGLAVFEQRKSRFLYKSVIGLFGMFAAGLFMLGRIDAISLEWRWGPDLIAARDSPYGNLAATEREGQRNFFANGLWLFTAPDPQTAEYAAHPAMLQVASPERALLIGVAPETLEEMLRHPSLAAVDVLEQDAALAAFAEAYAPGFKEKLSDPRVRLVAEDPATFLPKAKGRYDVILSHAGEPRNLQGNRFHTREFFKKTADALTPGGVFSFSVPAASDALGPAQIAALKTLRATLSSAFPQTLVLPGDTAVFLAKREGAFLSRPEEMTAELDRRGVAPRWFRDYYLFDRYSPFRLDFLASLLKSGPPAAVNTDFRPACFRNSLILSAQEYGQGVKAALTRPAEAPAWSVWAGLAALFFVPLFPAFLGKQRQRAAVSACAACAGAAQMAVGIVLLLAYQILEGFLYGRLALVIAADMAGLALGAWAGMRFFADARRPLPRLLVLQGASALFPVLLWAILAAVHARSQTGAPPVPLAVLFPCLALASGILGGLHFYAATLAAAARVPLSRAGGRLYAFDLLGAGAGALAVSLAVIPLFGVKAALLAPAVYCLAPLAALAMAKK